MSNGSKTRARKTTLRYQGLGAGFFTSLFLYNVGFTIYALIYRIQAIFKKRAPAKWAERMGRIPESARVHLAGKRVIWVQAVSVGEVVQAFRLIRALKDKAENLEFVLTTTTSTGYEVAVKLREEGDTILYFPADFPRALRSFVRGVNPEALIILETEIWPNLLIELSERGIPVFLINGRISDRAFPKYQRVQFFLKDILARFQFIAVQDDRMRERFLRLGASSSQVSVTGSMKYDWQPHAAHDKFISMIQKSLADQHALVWIAGSTHDGEEKQLFDVYQTLKKTYPTLTLMVAPRHLERLDAVRRLAGHMNIATRSLTEGIFENNVSGGVYVVDRMGILAELYQIADVVFVGGSLVSFGGHNLVEPAFFGKPILIGPHAHNFTEMVEDFKSQEAVLVASSESDLRRQMEALLANASYRQQLGARAKRLLAGHGGATQANAQKIIEALNRVGLV